MGSLSRTGEMGSGGGRSVVWRGVVGRDLDLDLDLERERDRLAREMEMRS